MAVRFLILIFNSQKVLVAEALLSDGVYKITTTGNHLIVGQLMLVSGETWHRRLGHINVNFLNKMKNSSVFGINYPNNLSIGLQNCEICFEGKQCRPPFKQSSNKANSLLDLVHSDVAGPMEVPSIGGSRYYVEFQDDFSKMSFVYFMKTKDEVFNNFKLFRSLVERQTGHKVKVLRTDNGGEYNNTAFQNYLKEHDIIHQTSVAYSPQQNKRAERLNRSLVEKGRCLLYKANLGKQFWAEAINCACYLRNRSAVSNQDKTPYEMFFNYKPDLSHVRIFGSVE